MGIIRSTFLIDPSGNITYVWPSVKVKGHVESVLAKLKELA
jgi:peroxiredoxin Q/BCP